MLLSRSFLLFLMLGTQHQKKQKTKIVGKQMANLLPDGSL